jgi:alpha-beta hydrolase superfamily lysophospholipase
MANNIKTIKSRIQQKHDIEANWLKSSLVPLRGELIVYDSEIDENGVDLALPTGRTERYTYARYKIGDGRTVVNDLPFATDMHSHDAVYKKIQTAKPDPTADGKSVTFIDTISQNAQGVITATKKTVNLDSLISSGTADPSTETTSQFYFKYSM